MSVPTTEQETTITFCRNEDIAHLWTSDPITINKWDKLYECSSQHKDDVGNVWAKEYEIPKRCLTFRSLRRKSHKMNPNSLQALCKADANRENETD